MAVDTDMTSLLNNLKIEDPWLPPRPWESICSENGPTPSSASPPQPLYDTSTVSETSLVRLAINASQGLESSLISIDKICAIFRAEAADRSFHRIPSLWNQSLSTLALQNILRSFGCLGCEVFFLRKFISYFTNLNWESEPKDSESYYREGSGYLQCSLVNQAFAVAVGKILEGYISALDTLSSSLGLRRLSHNDKMSSSSPSQVGCVLSIDHSDVTLLEVYLHTKGLRSQIEALGCICNVHDAALCFSLSPFEDLGAKTMFNNFPRGGDLLTYLYTQLKVADPVHCALLKILFLRSCEPYFEFIRSWIFKAKINDPFNEFIVAEVDSLGSNSVDDTRNLIDFASAIIRGQDEVSVPCFLRDSLVPLFRAGQQLQVLMKFLELCDDVGSWNRTYENFLPYWSGMSSDRLSYASPLAFTNEGIERMVCERSSYYKSMKEKLENCLTNLEFKYHQVIPYSTLRNSVSKEGGSPEISFPVNGRSISPSMNKRNQNLPVGRVDSDAPSMTEAFSYEEDPLEASSSRYSSEEEKEDEYENLIEFPYDTIDLEKNYFSALGLNLCTSSNLEKKPFQGEDPSMLGNGTCQSLEKPDLSGYSLRTEHWSMIMNDASLMMEAQGPDDQLDSCWPLNGIAKNPFYYGGGNICDPCLGISGCKIKDDVNPGVQEKMTSEYGNQISTYSDFAKEAAIKYQLRNGDSFSSQPWEVKYHSKYFCANPMLTKTSLGHTTSKIEGRCFTDYVPSFDFRYVKDPVTVCVDRLAGSCNRHAKLSVSAKSAATGRTSHSNGLCGDALAFDWKNSYDMYSHFGSKTSYKEQALLPHVFGGSGWELLLGGSGNSADVSSREYRISLAAIIEIPLDFVLEKCLLQEIQLQYDYVSKFTIKLLEEGFSLQEHLRALRRYHLMESADWADLFIMSLWSHKWYAMEADKRISEIQGLLELSVQRSSCERDRNKDRLFVYLKEQSSTSLTFASGICSFNSIGLGYRVDWPVSIILTPGALKIYAEIFNFLMQVKLGLSSLTEVWCSFKELGRFTNENTPDSCKSDACHFYIMVKLRHQIFHFVTTLQQYVQSQLSHVSWCRFLHSLKHKVKDLMDLGLVHMDYLDDSQRICFLSNDMEQIANIVQSILQCALDFRSALIPSNAAVDGDVLNKVSNINLAQVLAIKKTFDKNMRQLYICYLNSPKSVEFGLPRFWEYLNYNEHYSEVIGKEIGRYPTFF